MWFGSNFIARAFVRRTKGKKIDFNRNHLEDSDGSSLLSDSEREEGQSKVIGLEGEGGVDADDESESLGKSPTSNVFGTTIKQTDSFVSRGGSRAIGLQRAQTAGRAKRQPYIPRLIDVSRDEGDKV